MAKTADFCLKMTLFLGCFFASFFIFSIFFHLDVQRSKFFSRSAFQLIFSLKSSWEHKFPFSEILNFLDFGMSLQIFDLIIFKNMKNAENRIFFRFFRFFFSHIFENLKKQKIAIF